MSKWQRSMRNIFKQYGKNIKAFENMDLSVPKYIEDLYKKYDLDLNDRRPMISIRHYRWGNTRKPEDQIDTYEKLKEVANGS